MSRQHVADVDHSPARPSKTDSKAPVHSPPTPQVSRSTARGRGNGVAFAASIQRMQQTLGNRSLQRATGGTGLSHGVASKILQAASDILQNGTTRLVAGADPAYQGALKTLAQAQSGKGEGVDIAASDRLQLLDSALGSLQPAFAAAGKDDSLQKWVNFYVTPHVTQLRTQLNLAKARQRVDDATMGEYGVVEQAKTPREEATQLRAAISKQIKTIQTLNDYFMRFHDAKIDEEIEELNGGKLLGEAGKSGKGVSALLEVQNVLMLADGFLTLTDDEFQKKLTHIQNVYNGVATYADLVKAVGQIIGGTVATTASFAAVMLKAAGQTKDVAKMLGLARGAGNLAGNILGVVEIIHGLAVLADDTATQTEKEEGLRDVLTGGIWVGSKLVGQAALGAGVSTAVFVAYYELKLMAQLYGEARTGITGGWMNLGFKTLDQSGGIIQGHAEAMAKAGLLSAREKNPEQQAALTQVLNDEAQATGRSIDNLLDSLQPAEYGAGSAYKPGSYATLRKAFGPLQQLRGASTPEAAAAAAIAVLEKLRWCQEHQGELVLEESGFPEKAKEAAGSPAAAGG